MLLTILSLVRRHVAQRVTFKTTYRVHIELSRSVGHGSSDGSTNQTGSHWLPVTHCPVIKSNEFIDNFCVVIKMQSCLEKRSRALNSILTARNQQLNPGGRSLARCPSTRYQYRWPLPFVLQFTLPNPCGSRVKGHIGHGSMTH